MAAKRVKELNEEETGRVRAWSGTDFDQPGRPRTFSLGGKKKSIVAIAVDRSDFANQAMNWYLETLHRQDCFVLMLHVPELEDTARSGGMSFSPQVWQQMWQKEKAQIAALKNRFEEKLKSRQVDGKWLTLSSGGKPGEALCAAAEEYKASLLVTGTRGQGAIKRTIMGSVSDYVSKHCKTPVLIYKAQ